MSLFFLFWQLPFFYVLSTFSISHPHLCVNPLLQVSMMSSVYYSGLPAWHFYFLLDIFFSCRLCNKTLSRFSYYFTNSTQYFLQLFYFRNVVSPQDSSPNSLLIIIHLPNRLSYLPISNFTCILINPKFISLHQFIDSKCWLFSHR